MPDPIQPVGAMIQPPNPNQGIQALSGILGIQQQGQQLQLGQQNIAAGAANLQQTQQKNRELSGLASFDQNALPKGSKYWNGDDFDTDAYRRDATAIAPVYGPEVINSHISAVKNSIETQRTLQALGNDTITGIGDRLKGMAGGPIADKDIDDFRDAASLKIGNNAKGNQLLGAVVDRLRQAQGPQRQQIAANASSMLSGFPQLQGTTNAAGQIVNRSLLTGNLSAPGIVAPNQGVANAVNPTSSSVAGNTALTVGASQGDIERANEVSGKAQAASASVRLSQQVDALAKIVNSGGAAKDISGALQYVGLGNITTLADARTELQKDLGQLRGAVASRAGSDSRAAEILEGYPSDKTPENTIHYAMDYIRGSARQDLARANLLQRQGRAGFQMADTALTSRTDPLMHEYMALRPEERAAFYRRNFKTPQEAQQFKNSVMALGNKNAGPGP